MSKKIKKRKVKRRLRKEVKIFGIIVLLVIIILSGLLIIPGFLKDKQLNDLGFSAQASKKIKTYDLTKEILANDYYSDYLNTAITQEDFRPDNLQVYLKCAPLNKDDWQLFDRLHTKGYEEKELINLWNNLDFYEITPLLVYDAEIKIDDYIADCQKHDNSQESFITSEVYYTPYEETIALQNTNDVQMLVNQKYYLPENSEIELVAVPLSYASKDVKLQNECYEHAKSLLLAMQDENLKMWIGLGYRSYAEQSEIYNEYVATYGEEAANEKVAKPGHSDHQTGLAVDFSMSGTFSGSAQENWLQNNAYKYGFILRYPLHKEMITGFASEPWHWRYVGVELAKKVYDSNLTYDEYVALYL